MAYKIDFPHGLMFHRIHDNTSPSVGQGSISAPEFETILQAVGVENILPPDEWIEKSTANCLPQGKVCITFDDGLKCQHEICFPILEKLRIKAFWFVYSCVFEGHTYKNEVYSYFQQNSFDDTDHFYSAFFSRFEKETYFSEGDPPFKSFYNNYRRNFPFYTDDDIRFRYLRDHVIEKSRFDELMDTMIEESGADLTDISRRLWMSNSDLQHLTSEGHCVGLHSYSHPTVISRLSFDDQYLEYKKNYDHLSSVSRRSVLSMAHPCGRYNRDTVEILNKLGILCGFRSNMSSPEGGKVNPHPFELAREDCANILARLRKA